MPGEIDEHAIICRRHRGQPVIKLMKNVGPGCLRAGQHVYVVGRELTALLADQRGIDRLRITIGVA